MKLLKCDRCKQAFKSADYLLAESISEDYHGKDICLECDSQIQIAATVAKQSQIEGISQKEYLKQWIALYEDK